MSGIQPSGLTVPELLRYAHLKNTNGLPREWADALIQRLDEMHEEMLYFQQENATLEHNLADLEDQARELRTRMDRLLPPDDTK